MKRKILLGFILFIIPSITKANDWIPSIDSILVISEEIKKNKFDFAISYLPKVITYMENNPQEFNDTAFVQFSTTLSLAYQSKGDYESSDKVLGNVVNRLQERGIAKVFPHLEMAYGIRQFVLGNYNKAITHFNKMRKFYSDNKQSNEYLSIISLLISCYSSCNDLNNGLPTINEALTLIKEHGDSFSSLTKVQALSNSGSFLSNQGKSKEGIILVQKAYDIAKEDPSCEGFYNRLVLNLGTYYLNTDDYTKSLEFFKRIHPSALSHIEQGALYNSLLELYYFLEDEENACKYTLLLNEKIKSDITAFFSNYSYLTLDNIWNQYSIQLRVNMGALYKFKNNPKLNGTCYDNSLFIKNILYKIKDQERKNVAFNPQISEIYKKIKEIRTQLFLTESTDTNTPRYKEELILLESELHKRIKSLNRSTENLSYNWQIIQEALKNDEVAIEIVSNSGFSNKSGETELKLGALVISKNMEYPQYVELCKNKDMQVALVSAIANNEIGINNLYVSTSGNILYNLLVKKLEPLITKGSTLYISPTLTTQQINWGFIPCPDGKYLNEKFDIRVVSTTASLLSRSSDKVGTATIFGDIDYGNQTTHNGKSSSLRGLIMEYEDFRGNFGALKYSKEEIDSIQACLNNEGVKVVVHEGDYANEESFKQLDGHSPSILHIASHAYYLVGFDKFDDYFKSLTPYISRDESMLRSGILFNGANISLNATKKSNAENDGVVTAEEISTMDLSNTDLVVLSACESLIGNTNEGLGGLPKAFKLAGVHSILGSLWKVSDQATSMLMTEFYHNLSKGMEKHKALIKAQYKIKEIYPDPYYWAAFMMID